MDWGAVDDILYDLCRRDPDHGDRRTLTAKLVLINRAYQAGVERRVSPPPGMQAITVIADFVYANRAKIDSIVGEVRALREPLTVDDMTNIIAQHGRFTELLLGVTTDGKVPRSFASKYLHFHSPAVPIYDSYATTGLTKLVHWSDVEVPFDGVPGADPEYRDFCARFWRLYGACRQSGLAVTAKTLDNYLFAVSAAKA
jgi:hypothetical protein